MEGDRVSRISIDDLIKKGDLQLPSPPGIALRVLEAIRKDDLPLSEIGRIIQFDPAMAAKVLGVANSAFYSPHGKVETIDRALAVLGLSTTKNIALSFAFLSERKGDRPDGFDHDLFWRWSVTAAVAAEEAAPLFGLRGSDLFATSLLQDIGIMVLSKALGEEYRKIFKEKRLVGRQIQEIERSVLGFDHTEAGAEILKRWNFPESIHAPIRFHHSVMDSPEEHRPAAEALYLSGRIASLYHGDSGADWLREVRQILLRHGMDEAGFLAMVDRVAYRATGIMESLEVGSGAMKPISGLLEEARRDFARLNLSSELLVLAYRRARERAEGLVQELSAANAALRETDTLDALTGLTNHTRFQTLLDEQLDRSRKTKRPFCVALLDLDRFREINDRHGHPAGDRVLSAVSGCLRGLLRKGDPAARFGGEEFALLLPDTPLDEGIRRTEEIRAAVERLRVPAGDGSIPVTVSGGVAAFDPANPPPGKPVLLGLAERALYRSKLHGRNQVNAAGGVVSATRPAANRTA